MTAADIIGIITALTALISAIAALLNGRKISNVHATVKDNAATQNSRIEQLVKAVVNDGDTSP